MSSDVDREFAALAVKIGLVPEAAAAQCLALQEERALAGDEQPIGKILYEKGYLTNQSLVANILAIAKAIRTIGTEEEPAPVVIPKLEKVLIQNGLVTQEQVLEALAIQDVLRSQGLDMKLPDILIERGWADKKSIDAARAIRTRLRETTQMFLSPTRRQALPPEEPEVPATPEELTLATGPQSTSRRLLLPGADPEDRVFAAIALSTEMVGRLQIQDAHSIQTVYARHKVAKRLYEVLEELKYLSREQTGIVHQEQEKRMAISTRRERVEVLSTAKGPRIGELALERGLITEKALETALSIQKELARSRLQRPVGAILVELGAIAKADLARLLSLQTRRVEREAGGRPGEPVDLAPVRSRRQALIASAAAVAIVLGVGLFAILAGEEEKPSEGLNPPAVAREDDPEATRAAFDEAMERKGLVRHGERWVAPGEKRRLEEVEWANRQMREGRVYRNGRWLSGSELETELASEAAERLGLVYAGGEWLTREEYEAMKDGGRPVLIPDGDSGEGEPSSADSPTWQDAGGALRLGAVAERAGEGEKVRVGGAGGLPDGTVVRVVLLSALGPVASRHTFFENGEFFAEIGPFPRRFFPGTYRVRAEIEAAGQPAEVSERIGGAFERIAKETSFEHRPEERAAQVERAREEIESAVEILRYLAGEGRRLLEEEARAARTSAGPDPALEKEIVALADRMAETISAPDADLAAIETPFREARRTLRELLGAPWLDSPASMERFEEELDRILVFLAREGFALEPNLSPEVAQAGVLAELARERAAVPPDDSTPSTAAGRAIFLLAGALALRHRELREIQAADLPSFKSFSGEWLANLRAHQLAASRLPPHPDALAIHRALAALASSWLARTIRLGFAEGRPEEKIEETATREVELLSTRLAGQEAAARLVEDEAALAGALLAELRKTVAENPAEADWQGWSGDWTSRVLARLSLASRLASGERAPERASEVLRALALLLQLHEAHESSRSGGEPATPAAELEARIAELLGDGSGTERER
ncbi:MAG: hypothetical protein HY720_13375 [Planctomycetes bacterium]|nr:hypothetical protein [Planctomycetota bacterium]